MGLRDVVKNSVKAGMKALGDIPQDITYQVYTAGTGRGRSRTDPTYEDKTVEATVVDYKQERTNEGDLVIAPGDRKAIIEKWRLDAQSITPKKSDLMVIDGDTFKIMALPHDPTKSVYFFQGHFV